MPVGCGSRSNELTIATNLNMNALMDVEMKQDGPLVVYDAIGLVGNVSHQTMQTKDDGTDLLIQTTRPDYQDGSWISRRARIRMDGTIFIDSR